MLTLSVSDISLRFTSLRKINFVKKIGLLSDTHGYLDDAILSHLTDRDEVWHAGDFGPDVIPRLEKFKPLKGVFGNIDDAAIRKNYPRILRFMCEDLDVMITHIGGYPGHYEMAIRDIIKTNPPGLFISGHSHILKVMRDPKHQNLIHMNPGAAGKHGFHIMRTLLRFEVNGKTIQNLEVVELGLRAKLDN